MSTYLGMTVKAFASLDEQLQPSPEAQINKLLKALSQYLGESSEEQMLSHTAGATREGLKVMMVHIPTSWALESPKGSADSHAQNGFESK